MTSCPEARFEARHLARGSQTRFVAILKGRTTIRRAANRQQADVHFFKL
jgi:hypothetical protein